MPGYSACWDAEGTPVPGSDEDPAGHRPAGNVASTQQREMPAGSEIVVRVAPEDNHGHHAGLSQLDAAVAGDEGTEELAAVGLGMAGTNHDTTDRAGQRGLRVVGGPRDQR